MIQPHSFAAIPIIDLNQAHSPSDRQRLLAELHHALTSVGFLYIRNHGVTSEVISDMITLLPRLFALASNDTDGIALENSPHFLGYSSVGSETTAGKQDRREQFEFATELKDEWAAGMPLYERLKGPNQWPSTLPEARTVIEAYIDELTALSVRFLKLIAEALSLPDQTFIPFLSDQHRLKLAHYPAHYPAHDSASCELSNQGVGPHKDSSGWWTFLLQASPVEIDGLQALNRAGEWVDIPNIPDTFVVNIGQAFEVVTHGYCPATTHRVLSSSHERFSVPFFQGVRRDLTKHEALYTLAEHFAEKSHVSEESTTIDSAFLRGRYDTWGETQLRTKIRSHRAAGKQFYPEVYDQYINDDS